MRFAGSFLTLCLAASPLLLRAEEPAKPAAAPAPVAPEAKAGKVSPELAEQMATYLPKYIPPAPADAKPAAPNPDVVELPKVTVTQKKRPRLKITDEVMMTPKSFNEKLAKDNLSSFDRNFLNKFTWFGGQTPEERAREEYRLKQQQELKKDVLDLAKVSEVVDPAQAKELRDAINKP
jgi:hypothetical protein